MMNILDVIKRKILLEFADSLSDLKDLAIQMNPNDLFDIGIHLSPACIDFLKKRKPKEMIGLVEFKQKIVDLLEKEGAKFVVNTAGKPSYLDGEFIGVKQIIFVI